MAAQKVIYLDHHATTPVDPRVLKEMLPYFTEVYGNAASIDHDYGYDAKHAVDNAREQIAKAIKPVREIGSEIQKIQQALSFFAATAVSDGLFILLILSWLFYIDPFIGLVNLGQVMLITVGIITRLPGLSDDYAQLNELSGIKDRFLSGELNKERHIGLTGLLPPGAAHYKPHENYLYHMKRTATNISKGNLVYECVGAVGVFVVFLICIRKLQGQALAYSSFMVSVVLSYFLSMLMIKISHAVQVILEGAESALHHKHYLTKD